MPGRFEIKRAKDKEYFFNLLAPNGEVILTSEMYKGTTGAKKGVAVQANAGDPNRYDRRTDKRKEHYFVLKAAIHRVIGCSQMYSSAAAMEKGIKSVIKNGTTTQVIDTTS